jgi:hypothetical protein
LPNRIIKESICTSEEIDSLNHEQESFFYRLIVNCDDFGLLDARPMVLKAKCYPLKSFDIKRIQVNVSALVAAKLIRLYEVDGKPYLSVCSWSKHQQTRALRPKYPLPKTGSDINCNQLISDVPVFEIENENVIVSEADPMLGFDDFWNAYPKKVGKGAAEKAWTKAGINGSLQTVMQAVAKQKQSDQWRKDAGQYIPNPATWINQRRWEDGDIESLLDNPFVGAI